MEIGLRVKRVEGDGNCLFRAFSDQLCGTEDEHWSFRCQAADSLRANPDDFAPFVDLDEFDSFDDYVASMACLGEWGDHLVVLALSRALRVNVCIHQLDQPRWEISNYGPDRRAVHLSYHDGSHYNSVRLLSDDGPGRAAAFVIAEGRAVAAVAEEPPESEEAIGQEDTVERLVETMGGSCSTADARAALEACGWSEDAALERLVTHGSATTAAAASSSSRKPKPPMSRKEAKKAARRAKAAERIARATAEDVEPAKMASKKPEETDEAEPVATSLAALSI
jgi:OTU domain-containing protein 3